MSYNLKAGKLFPWWSTKVLPLVYDDALSYYEVLCKVMKELQTLIENEEAQNEAINDLDQRVTTAEDDIDNLETRMDTAEGDIDALEIRMDTAEWGIDALETRMDTAEGDIDALETRMDTAEGDIDNLETRMDTAEGDIDNLETRMDTAEGDIDALETRIDTAEGDIDDLETDLADNSELDKYVLENLLFTMGGLVDAWNPDAEAFRYYDPINQQYVNGDYFETALMPVIPGYRYYVKDMRQDTATPSDYKPVAIYLYGKLQGNNAQFIRALDLTTLTPESNGFYSFVIPDTSYSVRIVFHRGTAPIVSRVEGKGWGYFGFYPNNPTATYSNPYWTSNPAIIYNYLHQFVEDNNINAYDMTQAYSAGDFMRLGTQIKQARDNIAANTPYYAPDWDTWSLKKVIDTALQNKAQLNGYTISDPMTQAAYDDLQSYDSHTIYIIVG